MVVDRPVSFPSLHAAPVTIPARLRAPGSGGPHPAVVILHGAEGRGAREAAYAEALNRTGLLTLEPDLWAGRPPGSGERPEAHAALPALFGAHRFLAALDEADAGRIGVLGCGLGANAALLAAASLVHSQLAPEGRFAAFLAVCPTCHLYNRVAGFELADLVWAPILIATAALDEFDDDPDAGPALARSLSPLDRAKVRTAVFYGVGHGFDLPGPARRVEDPAAHRGAGGRVTLAYDAAAAGRAHGLAVQFFSEMKGRPTGPDAARPGSRRR